MPEVVQTGASVAIDFLSGFGKGMVQADINRREQEKHEIQKAKWKGEMSALAAQDELRKMQLENSRLEIDMRKTQFDDIVATREQTKGFVAFMSDAIGKAKGNPAERQSQLLEAYANGAVQFSMADRSVGDKLIDTYSKISQLSGSRKAWKVVDMKNYETGKKSRAIIDEAGNPIRMIPGEENLEIVNDIVDKTMGEYQDELDMRLQTFLAGKSAVVGAESQMLSFDDFMDTVADDDDRTKSERAMDWIFETRKRLMDDMHEETGTLDSRLGRRLSTVIKDKKAREDFVSAYAGKPDYISGISELIEGVPLEDRAEVFAQIEQDAETLIPSYDRPEIMMELARLQNKTALEMRDRQMEQKTQYRDEQLALAERVARANRSKEEELLKRFTGEHVPDKGTAPTARDWWDNFLGKGGPETIPAEDKESEAYETLRSMQER